MFLKRVGAILASTAMLFAFTSSSATASVASLKDCAFGPAQVFDVQYNFSGGNLNISGITRPYGNVNGQLSASDWTTGYYMKFVDSVSNPGTLALERFNAEGVSQGLVSTYGNFRAYGEDFVFFLGGDFYGTVITTGAGFEYGSSAALAVTEENPSVETVTAYTNCLTTPLAAGENRDDAGGGGDDGGGDDGGGGGDGGGGDGDGDGDGGGDDGGGGGEATDATLALNLKVRVGEILAGKEVEYNGEGLMPESEYFLELHSVVVELGSGNADAEGTFTNTVVLPDGIEPGPHRIILRGTDPDGNELERIAYILVGDDGRLLAKSYTGPIRESDLLASTGLSAYNPSLVATFAGLAIALGAVVLYRRRTGKSLG
jgi:hypothetical protein